MDKKVGNMVCVVLVLIAGAQRLFARELTDALNRSVLLPDQPRRIICLSPSLAETVFALGLDEAVVGVTDFTEYPPGVPAKPSVGELVSPAMEKIVSLQPDLVLAAKGLNRPDIIDQLEHLGIPIFVVNPQSLNEVLATIQQVGDIFNRSSEARALVNQLMERRRAVSRRVGELPRPRVFVVVWHTPVITAGGKAFLTDVISAAGGESVTADFPQTWPQISLEEVLRRAPDVLLLVRGPHGGMTLEELKTREGWNRLEAVIRNRVVYMDQTMEHPSPLVFDALEELARKLHPEAFQLE